MKEIRNEIVFAHVSLQKPKVNRDKHEKNDINDCEIESIIDLIEIGRITDDLHDEYDNDPVAECANIKEQCDPSASLKLNDFPSRGLRIFLEEEDELHEIRDLHTHSHGKEDGR